MGVLFTHYDILSRIPKVDPVSSFQREIPPNRAKPSSIDLGEQHEQQLSEGKERRPSEEVSGEMARTTFELFRTYDGEEYTVYMRDDGKRFYVDFEEQVCYTRMLYSVQYYSNSLTLGVHAQ